MIRPAVSRKLKGAARLLFGLGLLVLLIGVLGDASVLDSIRAVGVFAFAIAMALNVLASIVIPAYVSYRARVPGSLEVPFTRVLAINMSTRFYSMVLPSASASGARWFKYRREGDGTRALALMLLEKIVQIGTYAGAGALLILFDPSAVGAARDLGIGVTVILFVGSALSMIALFTSRGRALLGKVLRPVLFRKNTRFMGRTQALWSAISLYGRLRARRLVALMGWTAFSYLAFVWSADVVASAMGLSIGFATIGWMRSVVFTLTQLPISVGGVGLRELGFTGLMSLYGIHEADALAFSLVLLGIQVGIGLIGAIVELVDGIVSRNDVAPVGGWVR